MVGSVLDKCSKNFSHLILPSNPIRFYLRLDFSVLRSRRASMISIKILCRPGKFFILTILWDFSALSMLLEHLHLQTIQTLCNCINKTRYFSSSFSHVGNCYFLLKEKQFRLNISSNLRCYWYHWKRPRN